MKKLIQLTQETMNTLKQGKCVEGSIHLTSEGLLFNAYHRRKTGKSEPDKILYQSGCGHLKESKQRYRMWVSVPKAMGMCKAAGLLNDESDEMAQFLYIKGEQEQGGILEFV